MAIFQHLKTDINSHILRLYTGNFYVGGHQLQCAYPIFQPRTMNTRDITFQKVYAAHSFLSVVPLAECPSRCCLGTSVLANIWSVFLWAYVPRCSGHKLTIEMLRSMTHDDEVYENPFKFIPERFLDDNGDLTGNHRALAYGFGRR